MTIRATIPPARDAAPQPDRRWPPWLAKALVEGALIALSVLLALAVDEWREARARERRVATALASIRDELASNRREVSSARTYHRALADTLFAFARAGVAEPSDSVFTRGTIVATEIVSTAWESAQVTGATADMPYATVLTLAQAYAEQAAYERRKDAAAQGLYARSLEVGWEGVMKRYKDLASLINNHAAWERRLLNRYDRALRLGTGAKAGSR